MKKSSSNPRIIQMAVQFAADAPSVIPESIINSHGQSHLLVLTSEENVPKGARLGGAEAEFEKDVWSAHNIPGTRLSLHRCAIPLKFLSIPEAFRPSVKRLMKMMVLTNSWSSCWNHLRFLRCFAEFYAQRYPEATDFHALSREDVEAYVVYVTTKVTADRPQANIGRFRYHALMVAETWIRFLQASCSSTAPTTLVERLFWREDRGSHVIS